MVGGGNFDEITFPGLTTYESELSSFGIPFTDDRVNGGHEWYTWRQLLHDYLTTVAFRKTTTASTVTPGALGHFATATRDGLDRDRRAGCADGGLCSSPSMELRWATRSGSATTRPRP